MAKKHASSIISLKVAATTDAQEKSWLYLLSKYSANPVQALANYTVQFADNRQYVVGATLPVLLKEGQYDAAQKLLATLPANEMLEERYAVSVATRNKAEALRLARLLSAQEPANLTRLDQLTWRLMRTSSHGKLPIYCCNAILSRAMRVSARL